QNLDFTRDYLAAAERVTPDEVAAAARRWLIPAGLTSVSLNPKDALTKKRSAVRVGAPEAVRKHEFANGLTLLVREDARLPLVSVHASLRGGLLAEPAALGGCGQLMARTIPKGTGALTAEEIADRIESRGGHLEADSGGGSFSVSAHLLAPDWTDGLAIWSQVLLDPSFPESGTEAEAARQIAAIRQEEDHPSFVAFRELRRAAYGDHPFARTRSGTAESVGALTRQDLAAMHRSLVLSGNAVVAVSGSVGFDEAVDRTGEALASLPAGPRAEPEGSLTVPAWQGRSLAVPSEKRQAFLVVGFPAVDLRHPDRLALDLIDEACSDMASRLFE